MFLVALILGAACAHAVDLTFINNSGAPARIDSLGSRCSSVVKESSPVHIPAGGSKTFTRLPNVIHTFEVCGSGYCSNSAVGFKSYPKYSVSITRMRSGLLDTNSTPDEWPGNIECPSTKR